MKYGGKNKSVAFIILVSVCSVSLIYCCIVRYTSISSSMSKAIAKTKKGESRLGYGLCSSLPMLCNEHGYTESVRGLLGSEARRVGSLRLPMRTLHSRKALFEEGAFS